MMMSAITDMTLPEEVVKKARNAANQAFKNNNEWCSERMARAAICAALQAWPGCYQRMIEDDEGQKHYAICLPHPPRR